MAGSELRMSVDVRHVPKVRELVVELLDIAESLENVGMVEEAERLRERVAWVYEGG
jgi:hypothetical protein